MDVGEAAGDINRGRGVDFSDLGAGIQRRWRWMFWPTLIALVSSSAFVWYTTPRYTGVARVLLEDRKSDFAAPATASNPAATIDEEAMERQADSVANVELARKAVAQLGLSGNPEFAPGRSGDIDLSAVDKFLSRLTVVPVPRSRALQIEFVSRDPVLAARGANTVADLYLQSRAEETTKATRAEDEWLSRRIEDLRARVVDADAKVDAFRAQSNLLAGGSGQTVSTEQFSELSAQLAAARSAEAAATAKAQLLLRLEKEGRLEEAPTSIGDESMRRLVEQRAGLRSQIAEASRTLLPLHPRMKELAAQLAGLDGQVRDAAARNVRALESDARLAGDQVASLSTALAEESKTAGAGGAEDLRLRALESDAKSAHGELETYLEKSREAAARKVDGAASTTAGIIAVAGAPRSPTFPKAWQTVALAMLAALAGSTGVAAAASLASDGTPARAPTPAPPAIVSTTVAPAGRRDDVDLPSEAATIEDEHLAPERSAAASVFGALDSPAALANRLARSRPEGQIVALIAGSGSAAALPVALETARCLAARRATLLVDLGATQDWFCDILDREDTDAVEVPGLTDLIAARAGFGEVIRRDLSSCLDVIPSGGEVSGGALEEVFAALTSAYGRVILHASDWRSAPARTAAEFADFAVIIAPALRLKRALDDARASLGDACPEFIGYAARQAKPALEEVG
jgi:polysaccharide biosynthesis transport protein